MEGDVETSLERFEGAIMGAAAADALALPYLHYSRSYLRSLPGPLASDYADPAGPMQSRGQPTDDTQILLAACEAMSAAGGFSPTGLMDRMLSLWRDQLLVERDASTALALERLASDPPNSHGAGLEPGHAEIAPVGRALPIGLWYQGEREKMFSDVRKSTQLTHTDPRTIASAYAFAAAISVLARTEELILGPFLDQVAGAAAPQDPLLAEALLDLPRTLSMSEYRALRRFESLEPDDRYPLSEDGLGSYTVPALLTSVYYFLRAPYRYEGVVDSVLRVGGQIDTPAFLAGALCGALVGSDEIPMSLISGLQGSAALIHAARELYAAYRQQVQAAS